MDKIKLLLVDDELEITEIVGDIISDEFSNIDVIKANTSQEAALMMGECDIVLSDINMPDKHILDEAINKYIKIKPIARITGHYDGIEDYKLVVKKPFTFRAVKNMVDTLVDMLKKSNQIVKKEEEHTDSYFKDVFDYEILDTLPEEEFDTLAMIAQNVCNTSYAFIGFLDGKRQWFKAKRNFTGDEIPKEESFCYELEDFDKTVIINDMSINEKTKDKKYVVEHPFVRFYASVPIFSSNKKVIGRICVTDVVPRSLSPREIECMEGLAFQCMVHLENRKKLRIEEKSAAWKKAILHNSSYAILSVNTTGQLVTFNSAAERMFGYTQEEVTHPSFEPICMHIKSEIRDAAKELSLKLNTVITEETVFIHQPNQGECFEKEWNYRKKDGTTFPGLLSLNAVKDESNNVVGYIGIIKDLTEQREKDQLIDNQQNAILESSKMSSLGEMASSIAHEINNPLAILSGRCQVLIKQCENGTLNPESTLSSLNKMVATVERASKIIRGLKNFSRNSDGETFAPQKIRSVIDESLDLCEEKFKNNGIKIKVDYQGDYSYLGQGIKMSQVFINLLNNSFDALQKAPEKLISIKVIPNNKKISIIFTDSGPEIPFAVKEKMLSPFFTTKEIGKGTGIGLSISKGICEQHGGSFIFDKNNKNTTFIIELPLLEDENA